MSEKLYVKHPLFPMAGIAVSVFTFAFGLAMAKSPGVFFLSWRDVAAAGAVRVSPPLPCGAACRGASLRYFLHPDLRHLPGRRPDHCCRRMLALCIAAIPGLGLPPVCLVRGFSCMRLPRVLTLAMLITFTFFPAAAGGGAADPGGRHAHTGRGRL